MTVALALCLLPASKYVELITMQRIATHTLRCSFVFAPDDEMVQRLLFVSFQKRNVLFGNVCTRERQKLEIKTHFFSMHQ